VCRWWAGHPPPLLCLIFVSFILVRIPIACRIAGVTLRSLGVIFWVKSILYNSKGLLLWSFYLLCTVLHMVISVTLNFVKCQCNGLYWLLCISIAHVTKYFGCRWGWFIAPVWLC